MHFAQVNPYPLKGKGEIRLPPVHIRSLEAQRRRENQSFQGVTQRLCARYESDFVDN